jgi:hypothetical protein
MSKSWVPEFEKELQTQPGLELGFNSTIPPIAHNPDIEICVIPHQISVQWITFHNVPEKCILPTIDKVLLNCLKNQKLCSTGLKHLSSSSFGSKTMWVQQVWFGIQFLQELHGTSQQSLWLWRVNWFLCITCNVMFLLLIEVNNVWTYFENSKKNNV